MSTCESDVCAGRPMPANMSDLIPDTGILLPITNRERRDAAVVIAEIFDEDLHAIAFLLTELGLAEHGEDGHFRAAMEVRPDNDGQPGDWFTSIRERHDRSDSTPFFCVPPGQLDDRR